MSALVIAHRTCPRDAPENSIAGIRIAAELGADVVEVDVRRTRDGQPVLMHDRWLVRTTGVPLRVDQLTERSVRRLRLRGGGTVPSFAEALDALPHGLRIAVDVKDPGAGDAVVSETRNQGRESQVLFWSQHESALRVAVDRAPDLEISLLRDTRTTGELETFLADASRVGVSGISAHWSAVGPWLADRCDAAGLELYAWCKRPAIEPDKLARLRGLVTNWPALARQALDAAETRPDR